MADRDDSALHSMGTLLARLPAGARSGMLTLYRQSLQDYLAQAESLLAPGGDLAALRQVMHRLAGACGMMQDLALSEAARAMEDALREGREDEARALWPRVQACAEASRAAVDTLLGGPA